MVDQRLAGMTIVDQEVVQTFPLERDSAGAVTPDRYAAGGRCRGDETVVGLGTPIERRQDVGLGRRTSSS